MSKKTAVDSLENLVEYPFPDYVLEAFLKLRFHEYNESSVFCRHYESCPNKMLWLPVCIPNRTLQFRKALFAHSQHGNQKTCDGCMFAAIAKLCNYMPNKAEEEKIKRKQKELVAELAAELETSVGSNYEP